MRYTTPYLGSARRPRIHHARSLGFLLGVLGADHPVRYTTPSLASARRPRIHHARTLAFFVGAWGADHPVRYTTPYLGAARRPRMHHARTLVFTGGLGSGSSSEIHHAILRVRASPWDTPCQDFESLLGA